MARTILLTGRPGVGKTTVVREIARKLGEIAGGFYTSEIREGGRRRGFKIVTLDGQEGILADLDVQGRPRVSKYGVNLRDLEEIGVASLRRAVRQGRYVVVDEIGRMELLSEVFRTAVVGAIESDSPVIGTVMRGHDPWVDRIKNLSQVTVLEVTLANRDTMAQRVVDMLDHGSGSASS
jgi:nucleoside-triphosphatase